MVRYLLQLGGNVNVETNVRPSDRRSAHLYPFRLLSLAADVYTTSLGCSARSCDDCEIASRKRCLAEQDEQSMDVVLRSLITSNIHPPTRSTE